MHSSTCPVSIGVLLHPKAPEPSIVILLAVFLHTASLLGDHDTGQT